MVGHTGVARTLSRLLAHFYWKTIRKDVQDFIAKCSVCQQTMIPTQWPPELLQPIPLPFRCWEDLSLDFIVGLPSYKGFTTILVVVDLFSKEAHFGILPQPSQPWQLLSCSLILSVNIMASLIASFQIAIRFFSANFGENSFVWVALSLSTAYHHQTDGQTEEANKVLQQYLRCFVHHKPSQWGKFLSWAKWNFNTSVNSYTGFTPFEIMFGFPPPTMP